MELPKVLPKLTEAKTSPKGFLNTEDLKKIFHNMVVFLTPTILLYMAQLTGALTDHITLLAADLVPSAQVVGAFEGYLIATIIDYLKKLNSGKE